MKRVLCILACAAALRASDTIHVFDYDWMVPNRADWRVDQQNDAQVLHLAEAREPLPGPRRPIQFALANTEDFRQVTIEAEVKPLGRSLILVFAYRDPAHFDYAHLSADTGTKQPVHNGVFHVFGGERVRISSQDGPAAFAVNDRWYKVKLAYDGNSGAVDVTVDGIAVPALHAVDLSLSSGKIGLGSFDETGDFKNIKIIHSR